MFKILCSETVKTVNRFQKKFAGMNAQIYEYSHFLNCTTRYGNSQTTVIGFT